MNEFWKAQKLDSRENEGMRREKERKRGKEKEEKGRT